MRSLSARVSRIEKSRSGGVCPCGGPWRISMIIDGAEEEPEPCPMCGTRPRLIVLIKGTPPEGWNPEEATPCAP